MARTIELADGVYRIATDNYRLNTGLVLGLERALVVDTGAGPRQATEIYDEVRRLTRLPITVVNTHGHYERFFGNDVFAAMGAEEFWAHPRAARAIRKYGEAQRPYVETLEPEMAHNQGAATNIVILNRLVANRGDGITFTPIDLGERSATLMYMGPGHTDGDIMVGVEDVLFMGGLIEEGTDPYFEDSFPDRWIDTLGAVLEFDRYRVFVPGNGEPVDRTFVERERNTMVTAIESIRSSTLDRDDEATTAAMYKLPYAPGATRFLLDRLAQLEDAPVAAYLEADHPDTSGFTGPITLGQALP